RGARPRSLRHAPDGLLAVLRRLGIHLRKGRLLLLINPGAGRRRRGRMSQVKPHGAPSGGPVGGAFMFGRTTLFFVIAVALIGLTWWLNPFGRGGPDGRGDGAHPPIDTSQ